jgi:beta-barrel assembly-enhancing protease
MVEYENPPVPDHMNRSKTHPLWDLFLLSAMGIGTLASVLLIVFLLGSFFGRMIPFSWELALVNSVTKHAPDLPTSEQDKELQALANRLTRHMDLPDGMTITLHYGNKNVVNAYATVGGQVTVLGGLISAVHSENELAMVVAHEIAHVKHRDVAKAMTGAIMASLVYAAIFGNEGLGSDLFNSAGGLIQLSFSRDAEAAADAEALRAIAAEYGHANGAVQMFETLERSNMRKGDGSWVQHIELWQSHPSIKRRIESMKALAKQLEIPLEGPLTPLEWAGKEARESKTSPLKK